MILSLTIGLSSFAQLKSPNASPRTNISQIIGLVKVNLDYSRPSKKGRKIFGGLVPFNKIWRTGANNPTTISFSDDVKINNKLIGAGEYHVYSVPTESKLDLVIITTGGTGLTGRDITPEAIEEIADKQIPGFGEVFRTISLKTVGTSAIQSRACAVLANGKYVFALPGSSGGVTDAWDGILKYQLDINHKPCNFVELFPRLKEK